MIEHMVWIRFKPGVTPERQQHHLDQLASLKDRVPGIVKLAVGENFTDRSGGYTHGLLVTLQDRNALGVYATHPVHVAVAGPLKRDADLLALDIESAG